MTLTRWQPLRDIMSLRNAMDQLFEESFVRPARGWVTSEIGLAVPMDMYESDGNVVLKASLPGLKAEDVDVTITGDALTIKGEFKAEGEGERDSVHFQERRYGAFQRTIRLPTEVDTEAVEAEFKDGLLTLTLPKTEEAKPKRISVKATS